MIGCAEVMERMLVPAGEPVPCCGSCHDDADQGYWMCEIEVDGETVEVCCAVAICWEVWKP